MISGLHPAVSRMSWCQVMSHQELLDLLGPEVVEGEVLAIHDATEE